jgi:hypothetical protein
LDGEILALTGDDHIAAELIVAVVEMAKGGADA